MAASFSERYGYTKTSDCIIKGKINMRIINALSSCFTKLKDDLDDADYSTSVANGDENWQLIPMKSYYKMDRTVWTDFLNKRADKYMGGLNMRDYDAVQGCLRDNKVAWYRKLDCVEFAIDYMINHFTDSARKNVMDCFVKEVNRHFERLNYGYRVVQGKIVDIVSDLEIQSLNNAVQTKDNVSVHLLQALKLFSLKPQPDCRNSIKESITAVETLFREMTNESTFGKAFEKVKKQMIIHPRLEEMIQKMYDYTNQKNTGIRHAKVDSDDTYLPLPQEALLMLVSCSATINYIRGKKEELMVDNKLKESL